MRTLILALITSLVGILPVSAQNRELALQSGDRIGLAVGGIPGDESVQLNRNYQLSERGTISLLYLDEVNAAGVKPSELARKIEQLYISRQIYTHPNVTVSVDAGDATTARLVYASGEVTKPGPVPYRSGMTVSKIVTSAGGPTPFGQMKRVKLKRKGQVVRELNLAKAGSSDGDVLVEPEDEVVVPN